MMSIEEVSAEEKAELLSTCQLELSYETIPHTKVSPDYNVCLGIPIGTKGFIFMTFCGPNDVCYMMELNKERKISRITKTAIPFSLSIFANGTLLYGTFVSSIDVSPEFVIEDILMYQGIPNKLLSEKLGFIEKFLKGWSGCPKFHMATLWSVIKKDSYDCIYELPANVGPFHHIQYRCLNKVAPYLNVYPAKKTIGSRIPEINSSMEFLIPYRNVGFHKPQYKQNTVFKVRAEIAFDIYRLYAFGAKNAEVYYNVAYIPNYKTSVFMNGLFRNIRENKCLDAIEESDDEEDFENIDPYKYVDLQKTLLMECRFHPKFKKWVPIRVTPHSKVVHIGQL